MFFKRFMAVVLTIAMFCSSIVFAAEEGTLISSNPNAAETTQPSPTREDINKAATGFKDISPDAPYAEAVKKLVSFGIINGYEDGTFKPEGEVTRAEMCKMINLTLGYTDFEGAAGFIDVQNTNWYYAYALAAQKQGYVEGYEDGSFRGSNNITRQEVCAILNRLLKPMNLGIPVTITDAVAGWARPHVELIVQNFIMPLEANNTFRATENLKRHELATVLSNMAVGPVKPIEADVRFFVNGELYGETQTVSLGTCAVAPQDPAVPDESYVFEGWRQIGTENLVDVATAFVNNDIDYEAVFVKKTYTVTFYSRGASYATVVVEHGNRVDAPEIPEVKGYSFLGWSLSEDGNVVKLSSTKIDKDLSFYAVFEKESDGSEGGGGAPVDDKSYSVKFFVNGDLYDSQKVAKNLSPGLPDDPELEGFIFIGWSLSKDGEIVYPDSIRVTSAVTLYAVFEKEPEPEPEVFTVTFYADGKKHDSQYVEYGKYPTSVSNPEKDGYVFKHWSRTENGNKVEPSYVEITSNTNFYAVFEEEQEEIKYFTVTFMVGGSKYSSSKVQQGEKVSSPAAPSMDGYTFKGWSKIEGGSVDSVSVEVTSDLTFYAVFEKIEVKKYVVTFSVDGKNEDQKVVENETPVVPKDPEKDGYVFLGWSDTDGGEIVKPGTIQITYSRIFYAVFEKKEEEKKYYTITFISDGKTYDSQVVLENGSVSIPDDPEKKDYEFLGWSKTNGGSITEIDTVAKANATYYAVFKEIKKYTVTFYVDGKQYKQSTVVENETTSAPTAPSVDGYIFLGWSDTDGGEKVDVGSVKITENTSFYALLEEKEPEKVLYTVTFKVDGKNYDSTSVEEGKCADEPSTEPEKDGYTFKGWSKSNGGAVVDVDDVIINANTTFYAVFEKNPVYYEVIFVVDGDEYNTQEVLEGKYPKAPKDPSLDGYDFLGWSKTKDGTTVYPENIPVTSDTTYYAVFEEEEVEIVYYDVYFWFDGEYYKNYEVAAGETIDAPEIPKLEDGVSFLGWSLDDNNNADKIVDVSDVVIEKHTDFYSVLAKNPNSQEFMEKLTRGKQQLSNIARRASGYKKQALNTVTECIGYVIEDANNGVEIDKSYIGREYKSYVDAVTKIVYNDMSSSDRSQFLNQIKGSVDKDVQDFLLEYFDIDVNV